MHADGLDGLHELVREAARPDWARGDLSTAVCAAWAAVSEARPAGDVWFVEPGTDGALAVQDGIEALLNATSTLAPAAEAVAATSPQAAFELLSALSLCARFVEQAVGAEQVRRVVVQSAQLAATATPAQLDRLLAEVPRGAWPMVTAHLVDDLLRPGTTPAAGGTRALYLRIVEADEASAATAAGRCSALLRDPSKRRRAIAALSPSVLDLLEAGDRIVIPAVLALELQDGWLEGEHIVHGWAALAAAPLLWDDFMPGARAQIVEAIGFGLQNGAPELQAYLARVVCRLAPLLVGREIADLTRGLARAVVRRNALDAADQVAAAGRDLPDAFVASLLSAIDVQQPTGSDAATTIVRAALGARAVAA